MAEHPSPGATRWTWAAFAAALVTLAGSLYLSVGMSLVACPLCFYQRTFVMGVVGVLAVGLLTGAGRGSTLSALALPAAVGGVGVAAFHVYLELNGTLECPDGVLGIGTAPKQSLVALTVVLVLLVRDVLTLGGRGAVALLSSLVLGALFTWASIASAPPPKVPPGPYTDPLDTCRKPYRGT